MIISNKNKIHNTVQIFQINADNNSSFIDQLIRNNCIDVGFNLDKILYIKYIDKAPKGIDKTNQEIIE